MALDSPHADGAVATQHTEAWQGPLQFLFSQDICRCCADVLCEAPGVQPCGAQDLQVPYPAERLEKGIRC